MYGARLLVKTLSTPAVADQFGNRWQYHSRSDRHSKVACWGIAFDLLVASATLQRHVVQGKVGFGVNHEMVDFATGRKKKLDLVLSRPAESPESSGLTFLDVAVKYELDLSPEHLAVLEHLPMLQQTPVGAVLVALEAKACMTAHIKSLPRLYDELNSSHLTIHGASEAALAVGFVIVNLSEEFVSTDLNKFDTSTNQPHVSQNPQPRSTLRVLTKVAEIPRRTRTGVNGYDGMGVVVVRGRNDGGPMELVDGPPAPVGGDVFHYESMITRLANEYDARFGRI